MGRWQTKEGAFICSWSASNRIKVSGSYFHFQSIFLSPLIQRSRLRGVTAGSYPDSVWGEGLVTAWTGGQFITGSHRETMLPVSQVCVSLDCGRSRIIWAEAAIADARRRSWESNRQPSCCEATSPTQRRTHPGLHWPGCALQSSCAACRLPASAVRRPPEELHSFTRQQEFVVT